MGRVRGNKEGKFLSASLNGKGIKNFKNIKQTKALILVSIVGNEYCSGDYLQASIGAAAKRHEKATVLIADEVYWNNLRSLNDNSPADEKKLKEQAISLGDEFLEKNIYVFLNLLKIDRKEFDKKYGHFSTDEKVKWLNDTAKQNNVSFEIVRWKDWVQSGEDNFAEKKFEISKCYESDPELKKSIEETAQIFADRHIKDGDPDLWLHRSRAYLTEESPAVMWCAAKRGYQFIAYPGEAFAPFYATRDFFVGLQPKVKDLDLAVIKDPNSVGNWLDIYFKRHSGESVSNINPDSLNLAKAKLQELKLEQPIEDYESVGDFVPKLTTAILSDPKINANLKLSVLIAALGELNENLQQDRIVSCISPG